MRYLKWRYFTFHQLIHCLGNFASTCLFNTSKFGVLHTANCTHNTNFEKLLIFHYSLPVYSRSFGTRRCFSCGRLEKFICRIFRGEVGLGLCSLLLSCRFSNVVAAFFAVFCTLIQRKPVFSRRHVKFSSAISSQIRAARFCKSKYSVK